MTDNAALNSTGDLKVKFAEALLRDPNNPYKAACVVFPGNQAHRDYAATNWPFDNDVLVAKQRLIEELGEREFLPSREEAARMIIEKAKGHIAPDDFVKCMKLYGDYMGFIEKPGLTVNNNTQIVQPVMKVPYFENESDWEQQAVAHQANLQRITLEGESIDKQRIEDGSPVV